MQVCVSCGVRNPDEASYCQRCQHRLFAWLGDPLGGLELSRQASSEASAATRYAGFWIRAVALTIDLVIMFFATALLGGVCSPILETFYGFSSQSLVASILLPYLFIWVYFVLFTACLGQTPGKMMVKIKVVNGKGDVPGLVRSMLREILGKIISFYGLGLGFFWAGWNQKKRGWHDFIAGTTVIRT